MILEVQGLGFAYNGRRVFEGVGLSVAPGELLAILGPNGVGKTTLLRCLGAIHRPQHGQVHLQGRDLLELTSGEVARLVGYVAQRTEPASLTVFDAVLMGRTPHLGWRVGEADLRRVDAALRRLGLTALALRRIDRLSGGELQRVAIARALVQEPRLLLLDEPTSSLDLKNQVRVLGLIRAIVDGHGIAAVMTLHDLNLALRFADKVLFLKDGRVHAAGRAAEVSARTVSEVYGLAVEIHRLGDRPTVVPLHRHTHHHEEYDHDLHP